MIEDASMPADLFPGLLGRREKIADVSVLARDYGILLGGAQERIAAAVANGTLATSLGIVTGGPVIVLDRVISMLGSERPVEWRIAHCRLDESYYLSEIR
jgi:DNA-binding GntR family transcriptional regulator